MKPRVCVEIGSARGRSACFVGLALKENRKGHLYAIDPHTKTNWNDSESVDTYDILQDNLKRFGLGDYVTIVRKTSAEACVDWSEEIDVIFIDGDHSYEGVKADWELFLPFLGESSVVIFHDTLWDIKPDPRWQRDDMGVPRFVDELRAAGYPVITIERDFGVSLVQPVKNGICLSSQVSKEPESLAKR